MPKTSQEFFVKIFFLFYLFCRFYGATGTLCPWVLEPRWMYHCLWSALPCTKWSSESTLRAMWSSQLSQGYCCTVGITQIRTHNMSFKVPCNKYSATTPPQQGYSFVCEHFHYFLSCRFNSHDKMISTAQIYRWNSKYIRNNPKPQTKYILRVQKERVFSQELRLPTVNRQAMPTILSYPGYILVFVFICSTMSWLHFGLGYY